jgi:hypothetical protein
VMLTTHPLLVPRLRKSRSCTSCHPDAPLWSVTGPLYLLPFTFNDLFLGLPVVRFSSDFTCVSHFPCVLHAEPISRYLNFSSQEYYVRSKNCKDFHFVIFSVLLLRSVSLVQMFPGPCSELLCDIRIVSFFSISYSVIKHLSKF